MCCFLTALGTAHIDGAGLELDRRPYARSIVNGERKIMAKTNLRLVAPNSGLRTVTLRRRSNSEMGRDREHLNEREVECLIKAAKGNRHGHRDATMILIGFRHGLRVSELCSLQCLLDYGQFASAGRAPEPECRLN